MSHTTIKSLLFSALPLFLLPLNAQAQTPIEEDGTTSTTVTNTTTGVQIDNGDRSGGNLFHSFQEFSVPTGQEAFFNNASDIANIFSRVTGSNISEIDGSIRANGTANLFLINPNGIIFGENASLNIGGSFFATTADSILFDDGVEFSASDRSTPLLTSSIPIGANFRNEPGTITNQSASLDFKGNSVGLQVDSGQSLTLVGGDLNFNGGKLTAPGGRVELAAVATEGTVTISQDGSLSFPENVGRGNVSFDNGSRITVNPLASGNAGNINIIAEAIALKGVSVLNASNLTATEGNAGKITLQASGDLSLVGSGILTNIGGEARGNVGEIVLEADSISFTEGSQLQAGFFSGGVGNGTVGKVTIRANDTVTIDNSVFFANNQVGAIADSSDLEIIARNLSISNGTNLNVDNFGQGNAGNITLQASEDISFTDNIIVSSNIGNLGIGNVGNIEITANSISLAENSQLQAGFFAGGQGNEAKGKISLQANDSVTLNSSSILVNNEIGAIADTIDVEISANSVSFDNSALLTTNDGVGDAGNVGIEALDGSISLINSTIFTNSTTKESGNINFKGRSLLLTDNSSLGGFTSGEGGAGNVTIQATDFVTLDRDSSISVFASGTGTGGNVTINSAQLNILNDSSINAFVFGNLPAGEVKINTTDAVTISNDSSLLLNTNGDGDAASLKLNTKILSISGGSQISSTTFAGGKGGKLVINASDAIELTGTTADGLTASRIDASTSGSGAGGDIQVTTSNLTIKDGSAISSFNTIGSSGEAGNITLNVSDSIEIGGFRPLGFFSSSIDTESGGTGNAGNIEIDTSNLIVSNGAKINAATTGQGNGGIIDISATELIEVSGFIPNTAIGSQISSQSVLGKGAAGKIAIATPSLLVRDAGQINVSSFSTAIAGNLEIDADVIELDNFGILNAQTFGGEGNINLSSKDIILKGQSNITTNAFGSSTGGNITIETDNLVAFPNQNSDISANAENSFGGRVSITAKGIFGTEFRDTPTPQSDITATSELGADFSGEVAINTPEVDPSSGLVELPESVGDASDTIAQNPCEQGIGSEFLITGKGGFPANPQNNFSSDGVRVGLVEPVTENQQATVSTNSNPPQEETKEIVPARGWVFNDEGKVVLTAYDPTQKGVQRTQKTFTGCTAPQNQARQDN